MLNYDPKTTAEYAINASGVKQFNDFKWIRKAIIESRKDQFFTPLASVINMPKHFGKTVKIYEYVPLLDDRNISTQGINASGVTGQPGNLYGSSKDTGTIVGKLPLLGENGGRVNRVTFTRLSREAQLYKFGMFYEFSAESLNFDTDDQLKNHLARELMNGALEITEDVLQKDLLASAGVIVYTGIATNDGEVTGEGANPSVLKYEDFERLSQILTDNRTPKHTKVITGSTYTDTMTIPAARVMYVGSEMVSTIKTLADPFGQPAFIPVQKYAAASNVLNNEIGSISQFRIIEVPEMQHWAGIGATETSNPGYRATGGKYDVYPLLVVGDDSFATIGFQTDNKTAKFSVLTKMPGIETAHAHSDPYGETGFSSIKWYYGFLAKRPERIGLIKTVAKV